MTAIVAALLPPLCLVAAGFVLKRGGFVADSLWPGIEKLTYFVFFPALLVHNIAAQDFGNVPLAATLAVSGGTLAVATASLIGWWRIGRAVGVATFTSIFQGGVRFNAYVTLAVSQALFGTAGLRFGAVAAGLLIVQINLLCIAAFALWGARAGGSWRAVLRDIAGNPLILACFAGGLLSVTGSGLPAVADEVLSLLGRAALPLGLLAVGAVLRPAALAADRLPVAVASVVQFGVKPLVAAALIGLVGLAGVPAGVLTIAFATPAPPTAYILARQLGGDTDAMASIITLQTLLAFLVLPLVAWWRL